MHLTAGCYCAQVWEIDRNTLQQHALPLLHVYFMQASTQHAAHDMLHFLPGVAGTKGLLGKALGQSVRTASPAITRYVIQLILVLIRLVLITLVLITLL